MIHLKHHVKVFVYQHAGRETRYLMLKRLPEHEGLWGPMSGPIQPWENPEKAVLRQVKEYTGLQEPIHLLDLKFPDHFKIGDLEWIEWIFGYQVNEFERKFIHPHPQYFHGFRWEDFESAYQVMEADENRKAMFRLHMEIAPN